MKFIKMLVLSIAALSFAACSSISQPGSKELETQLKPTLQSPLYDILKITKLSSKKNEEEKKFIKQLNIKVDESKIEVKYNVEYEVELKFKRDFKDIMNELKARDEKRNKDSAASWIKSMRGVTDKDLKDTQLRNEEADQDYVLNMATRKVHEKFGEFKAGEVKKYKDTCLFVKTDNGWKLGNN